MRFFIIHLGAGSWSQLVLVHRNQLCTCPANLVFGDFKPVAANQPRCEYLQRRNQQTLQVRAFLFPYDSPLLNIH